MKCLILPLTACFALIAQGAIAWGSKPHPVKCYFFRGQTVELSQTCTFESQSWMGGGVATLTWEDKEKTSIAWGIYGRGERFCPEKDDMAVDRICGKKFSRHPETLKTLSKKEEEETSGVHCVEVKRGSVCWK
jgi:hypothetical protein